MTENRLSDSSVRILKTSTIVLGCLMILVALLSNVLGLSVGSGLSRNQIGIAVAGVALIISGVLGRRFPGFYRGAALMLLNIVLAIVLIEFLSLVTVKLIDPERFSIRARKIEQGHLDQVERAVVLGKYAPFVVWRSNQLLNCDSITIDDDGYRVTPGISHDREAFRVFTLGGSAMWGTGVHDSCTIAAYLQKDLPGLLNKPVAVFNMAQTAHSSTQEIIELMLQLRNGNIPDLVIFYDGFNDVWGAYESGMAGVHHSLESIAARVEGRVEALGIASPSEVILRNSNIWLLITSLRSKGMLEADEPPEILCYRSMGIETDSLARDVIQVYYGNCEIVESLSENFGFDYLIVWHPCIWCGSKHLTDNEKKILEGGSEFFIAGGDPAFMELIEASYDLFEYSLPESVHFASFEGIFDDIREEVYIDPSGAHVTPEANQLIVDTLLVLIPEVCQFQED